MTKKTEVAVQETKPIATLTDAQLALQAQMAEDVGSGFEEATADCYAIPFVYILQSGSPQCKKSDGAYIQGAAEGQFFNSVSMEMYDGDEGIDVVPVLFQQRFIAWGLREKGGGFKGEYTAAEAPRTHKDPDPTKNRDILNDYPDQQLVDTRVHYCLMKSPDDSWQPVVITFSSTQVKKSKQWMSRMQAIQMRNPATGMIGSAPMASRTWRLSTVPESNDQGSWFGYKIGDAVEHLDPDLYAQGTAFRKAIQGGKAKAQHIDPNNVGSTEDGPEPF